MLLPNTVSKVMQSLVIESLDQVHFRIWPDPASHMDTDPARSEKSGSDTPRDCSLTFHRVVYNVGFELWWNLWQSLYCIFSGECVGERILKIVQYLVKLWQKLGHLFFGSWCMSVRMSSSEVHSKTTFLECYRASRCSVSACDEHSHEVYGCMQHACIPSGASALRCSFIYSLWDFQLQNPACSCS